MATSANNLKDSVVMGGTFNAVQGDFHTNTYVSTGEGRKGMDLLTKSIASGAFHNSAERYDPPKCHPSTRVAVLEHIMAWINDLQKLYFFMWLFGPAGAGKSAIAQSIAELCHDANLLAASFFFSRTVAGRNDESRLISTLVYQLCLSMPVIRKYVEHVIEQDPLVLSRSLEAQLGSLVVDPLRRAMSVEADAVALLSGPKLIIIDGLDECGKERVQRYILSVLSTMAIPLPISFLIVSRPEQVIRDAFHAKPLNLVTSYLALDDSYRPDDDIKLFFESKFNDIKHNHPLRNFLPLEWPSHSDLVRLVQKSSGQFIYASTVMKYLDSSRHRPTDRLDIIFGLSGPGLDTPFAELDALYIHIFSTLENINKVMDVVSLLILTKTDISMDPQLLETIFFLRPGDIYIILSDLHSVMDIPAADRADTRRTSIIRFFHASLGDFLLDKSRSAQFYIDAGSAHANLTWYFVKHLSKTDLLAYKDDKNYESFAKAFIMHCPLSSPTPELLGILCEFDFYRFLTIFGSSEFIKLQLSYVFDWLKGQSPIHPSGKDLYMHHLHSLDEYLKSQLALCMAHSILAQLMVTAVILPTFIQYRDTILNILGRDLNPFSLTQFVKTWEGFIPLWDTSDEDIAKYHILLSQFLGDPIRSKEFYIDGEKLATFAMAFVKNCFGPSVFGLLSDAAPEDSQEDFSECASSCLLYCLPRASPSKDLAVFLQHHDGSQGGLSHSYSSEETVKAIKAYILRCKVSEKMVAANQFDQMNMPVCTTQIVSTDDLKSSCSNLTIRVGNSSTVPLVQIQEQPSHTEYSNCCSCHVM